MDEILIEEKRYVSSKRAAKLTGYAKDYIGQLCREGRVPARLVGRSWYVLESAIQDHRFGTKDVKPLKREESAAPEKEWESPRYEATSEEHLPVINRLKADDSETLPEQENEADSTQYLHDSWGEWFSHVAKTTSEHNPQELPAEIEQEESQEQTGEPGGEAIEEVKVPIHTVYDLPPRDLLPTHRLAERVELEEVSPIGNREEQVKAAGGSAGWAALRSFQVIMLALAALFAVVGIIGSGFYAEQIVLIEQAKMISGTILYDK